MRIKIHKKRKPSWRDKFPKNRLFQHLIWYSAYRPYTITIKTYLSPELEETKTIRYERRLFRSDYNARIHCETILRLEYRFYYLLQCSIKQKQQNNTYQLLIDNKLIYSISYEKSTFSISERTA